MKFSVPREDLLKPLMLVAGVVEKRQTSPVLGNVLIKVVGNRLSLTGTDREVEIVGRLPLPDMLVDGEITVSAKKLVDICKSLPDDSQIECSLEDARLIIKSGRSRFVLSTLPASDFPATEPAPGDWSFSCPQQQVKALIDATAFAMAQQDVRYYLNGMLWEVEGNNLRLVSTDGHRMAIASQSLDIDMPEKMQAILPRKGVIELSRLLNTDGELSIQVTLGAHHIRVETSEYTFTSKLIDAKFPPYENVLPKGGSNILLGDRLALKQAFGRVAILSNEKYRGVRLQAENNLLTIVANNPEQEEAEERVDVNYQGETLEIGFNVSYLLDVVNVLDSENVQIILSDSNSSALIKEGQEQSGPETAYVIMPMRL